MRNHAIRVCSFAGLSCVAVYLVLAVAAACFYPASFGPAANWLSDLGNRSLNPSGAVFYRLAGVLGGAALMVFFFALGSLARGERKQVRVLLLVAQVCGILASAFFALTGVFSEDMMPMHSWFSRGLFIAFGTAVALTGIAILRGTGLPRWLAGICVGVWLVDIVSGFFGQTRWLEWVVVALLIAYITAIAVWGLLGAAMEKPAPR
jgi:hypothetical membrane protein